MSQSTHGVTLDAPDAAHNVAQVNPKLFSTLGDEQSVDVLALSEARGKVGKFVLLTLLLTGFVFREHAIKGEQLKMQGPATIELFGPAQRAKVLLGENQELPGAEDSRTWTPRTLFRRLFDLAGIAPVPILMTSLIRNETGQGWKNCGHVSATPVGGRIFFWKTSHSDMQF